MGDQVGESLYERLGVDRTASQEEIKRCYRQRAKQLHPDLNATKLDLTERFRALRDAYEILSDPERRAHYDRSEAERRWRARQRTGPVVETPSASRLRTGMGQVDRERKWSSEPAAGPLHGRTWTQLLFLRSLLTTLAWRPGLVHRGIHLAVLMMTSLLYMILFGLLGAALRMAY